MALALTACGAAREDGQEPGPGELATSEAGLSTYPQCCSAIPGPGYTEAYCDAVAYSPGRCNQVVQGTACQWSNTACPVTCCQPKSSASVPWTYCNPYATSAATCNAVNGGTTCAWAC
ncbi:hypothetical protein KRR26_04185 [Corallococcus sp. M34]|uniref:hypothetical protein n=1 Tax=Citreicoccus inhibens TaxID=2849499 RepID=UPI001C217E19|nr:hypothetical protein [Citreicoccus inhibens]MBU8894785.1 hypothetical protein [Citreicoccus inhibens]